MSVRGVVWVRDLQLLSVFSRLFSVTNKCSIYTRGKDTEHAPKERRVQQGPGGPRPAWPLVRVHGSVLVSILMYFPLMFVYSFFILGGEGLVFFK